MIKKFNEFIKEGFMTRTLNRKNDTDKRLEVAKKYKTSLGETIEVSCSPMDVDECIDKMINYEPGEGGMYFVNDGYDEGYPIGHDIDGEEVSLAFDEYEKIKEEFETITYDDYEAITGCVANKIKKVIEKYNTNIVVRNDCGYIMLISESKMDSLCENDYDRYDDNSGYGRLLEKIREYVGNKNGYETDEGIEGLGDEPHYISVRINEWFINNFDGLYDFMEKEWDDLVNYDPYDEE